MKKFLLATVGIAILGIASASAADIPRREAMPAKAPVYVAPAYNWTGPYIGLSGGYAWGGSDAEGGLVGGTLGYNYQTGPWVFGLEGDISWTNINGSSACGATTCETRNDWLGTARGRLGYAMGNGIMPYITGGAAFGNIENNVVGVSSSSSTELGWTLGGGLEASISGPWTVKVEYLYVDLGEGPTVAGNTSDFHTNIVRAGLNYRF